MDNEKICVLIHSFTGVSAGVLSNFLGTATYALVSALVIVYSTGKITELVAEKEGTKWWLGNGVVPFTFLWLISWVFLYNL